MRCLSQLILGVPNLAGTINTRIIKFQEVRFAMFDGLEALCLRKFWKSMSDATETSSAYLPSRDWKDKHN